LSSPASSTLCARCGRHPARHAERNADAPAETRMEFRIYQACLKRLRSSCRGWRRCSGQCRSRSAFGEGAELRRPLGITIVGGLFVSQVLTLFRPHAIEQLIEKVRFAGDSPLEGAGSELPVPVEIRLRFQAFSGTGPPLGPAFVWISEASPRQYSVDELVKRILVEPAQTHGERHAYVAARVTAGTPRRPDRICSATRGAGLGLLGCSQIANYKSCGWRQKKMPLDLCDG
jgi:hypothetical protein